MMPKWPIHLFLVCCCLFVAPQAIAQPQLPDIAGATVHGINLLTWTNQYDNIKSIEILRSADSINNFAPIATIKTPQKGVAKYTDAKPLAGNNWYELSIEFHSSLKWNSKILNLYVDSVAPSAPKDSLKHITPSVPAKIEKKVIPVPTTKDTTIKPLLRPDTLLNKKAAAHIQLKPDTTVADAATFFKSKYVAVDAATGFVRIELPDVKKNHYSLRFFDQKNKQVVELPKVNASPLLLDMRNFQRKGVYHFVIKKDSKDFDQGYIVLSL